MGKIKQKLIQDQELSLQLEELDLEWEDKINKETVINLTDKFFYHSKSQKDENEEDYGIEDFFNADLE